MTRLKLLMKQLVRIVARAKVNIQEIKELHEWQIPTWINNFLELGKCMDDIESRLIREGKLKIVKGRYVRLEPKPVKPEK